MKYLMCILLPPVAVLMVNRKRAFVLNLILTCCLWVPGVIHAWMVVSGAEADARNEKLMREVRKQNG